MHIGSRNAIVDRMVDAMVEEPAPSVIVTHGMVGLKSATPTVRRAVARLAKGVVNFVPRGNGNRSPFRQQRKDAQRSLLTHVARQQ